MVQNAKFDAASFILGGEIRNRTNTQTKKTSTSVRTDLYPHMPILSPHAARYSTNGVRSPTGTFIALHALADSSDFGLLGEQSSSEWAIPCLGRQ